MKDRRLVKRENMNVLTRLKANLKQIFIGLREKLWFSSEFGSATWT